jgi:membrane-bound lytic murein transglycosylase A
MTHMTRAFACASRLAAAPILGTLGVALVAAIAACSTAPPTSTPTATAPATPPRAAETAQPASPAPRDDLATATLERPRGRWVAASWSDLPDWGSDRLADFWPAFLRSCERPAPAWLEACAKARTNGPVPGADDAALRAWLQRQLRPYRVESSERDPAGLATGYFEPLVDASRASRPGFRVPLYAPPPDLASRKPYWTRHQIETLPAAQRSLHGHEIAWLRDPLDALMLQIQGSGRLAFANAHGTTATVRVAYAAHNDQPYLSIGRWLIDQGELRAGEASWPAIRAWARQHPARVDEMLRSNPRVVFFREESLPDPAVGPKGAQGVPLTPGRSIAVDPQSVPYGTPVWLDTTEPLSTRPLRRLAVAQDTGSAIVGAVRADYFWGWGDDAEAQAGRMRQPLRMWVLWPVQNVDERVGAR